MQNLNASRLHFQRQVEILEEQFFLLITFNSDSFGVKY